MLVIVVIVIIKINLYHLDDHCHNVGDDHKDADCQEIARDETVSKATAAAAQGVNRRRSNVVKEVLMQISIMMIMMRIPMMI